MAEEQPQDTRPFPEVQQEVRRLFQELVHQPWGRDTLPPVRSWRPQCDMVETDDALIVEVELPGVKHEDVRLEVEGDMLHITGERHASVEHRGHNYHYLEQNRGRFERQLRLPRTVDRNAIQANFSDGILRVTLPKKEDEAATSPQPGKGAS